MGRRNIYTKEHIEYLREIAPGRYNDEITRLFNKKFSLAATETAIRTLKQKHNILSNVPRGKKQYTQEQIEFLRELSEKGLFNSEMARLFNQRFGTSRTESAIKNMRTKYGLKTSARKVWQKGHEPWNKGRKGVSYEGMKATQYKKGSKAHNWVPIGSERITKDGYIQVKVQDGQLQKNWKGKHILVWEEHNGPVPPGHAVIFGDGNIRNFSPGNLLLVSRKQLARLNQRNLIQNDVELTKTGVLIADIYNRIGEKKKK